MTTPQRPPKDGIRAMPPGSLQGDGKTLTGRLATGWAEIESVAEGHFMERFAPNAFKKAFSPAYRDKIKVLFQHGRDNSVGQQPIAVLQDVGEDADGAYYRAELLDGVPPLILDGLRRGVYGSSHTFRAMREDWETDPKKVGGPHNPKKLPERVVREADVWEFGPVTWPAYAGSAIARSMLDEFNLATLTEDAEHLRNLVNYIDPDAPSAGAADQPHPEPERSEAVAPPTIPKPERKVTLDQYVTREEKASRVTELKDALKRQAVEYPGVLPADAQATWDADSSELETLERDIKAWDDRQARLAAYANDPTKVERSYEPVASFARKTETDIYDVSAIDRAGSQEQRSQLYRDNAMRAVEISSFPHPDLDADSARTRVAYLLDYKDNPEKELAHRILTTGRPQYRRAFNKALIGQQLSPEEQRAALEVHDTGGLGGNFAVPFAFDPTIVGTGVHQFVNPFRAACRVETIVGTNEWKAITSTAVVAYRLAEASAATNGTPTFSRPSAVVQRVTALVQYSIEMNQDRPDLGAEMARLIGEAKDNEEMTSFAIGPGTTITPWGMFSPLATQNFTFTLTTGTAHTLYAADILAVEAALPLRHRANAAWFMSRAIYRRYQALETSGGLLFGGQYYNRAGTPLGNSPIGTMPPLLGYPVWEVPTAPSDISIDHENIAVFGDPANFLIVDRVGMNVEIIPHLFDATAPNLPMGIRGLFALWRNHATSFNIDGMRTLQVEGT
jgi:HK97 family phage major capsid protein